MEDTTIPTRGFASFLGALGKQNIEVEKRFHGDSPKRQPVHTFNGGAHLFKSDTAQKLGRIALQRAPGVRAGSADAWPTPSATNTHSPNASTPGVVEKLHREPIEDYRH